MPRGPRILLNGVCYHIINRGNQKQEVFFEEPDFEEYLRLVRRYKKRFGFRLFGYCLMPNHVHLILEPKRPEELSKFMQGLTQTYTTWFNKKYGKPGRLWQGRFKSMVIEKDEYFISCIKYVEANPVRASIASSPAGYTWSSFKDRVFGNKNRLLDFPDST